MKRLKFLFTGFIVLLFSLTALAQYSGPGPEIRLVTVKEVQDDALKLDRKDTLVKIKGFIVEKVNEEEYVFSDETGKIRVEIEEEHITGFEFDETTEVVITAEVDYDMLNGTELEVEKSIERADGLTQKNN